MDADLSYSKPYYTIPDAQILSGFFISPWASAVECAREQAHSTTYSEVMEPYKSLAELYRSPDSLDRTAEFRLDSEDDIAGDEVLENESPFTREVVVPIADNTQRNDIDIENMQFNLFLESRSQEFLRALSWVDFEDGMENDIVRLVSGYVKKNKYVTYCWLNKIFNDNRTKPIITSSILRTLGMVVNKNDADYMLSMVVAGLSSKHPEDQEAAIMVIEKWRTKECLYAMLNTTYGSDWVKEYAIQVVKELRKEVEV